MDVESKREPVNGGSWRFNQAEHSRVYEAKPIFVVGLVGCIPLPMSSPNRTIKGLFVEANSELGWYRENNSRPYQIDRGREFYFLNS